MTLKPLKSTALRECPFCGGEVEIEPMWTTVVFGPAWTVRHARRKARGCKMVFDIDVKTKRAAIRRWNTRNVPAEE